MTLVGSYLAYSVSSCDIRWNFPGSKRSGVPCVGTNPPRRFVTVGLSTGRDYRGELLREVRWSAFSQTLICVQDLRLCRSATTPKKQTDLKRPFMFAARTLCDSVTTRFSNVSRMCRSLFTMLVLLLRNFLSFFNKAFISILQSSG